MIRAGVIAAAAQVGGSALIEDALLDEVTALVEWPVPLTGQFEQRFLSLPREVVIATVQDHQRYFAVQGPMESCPAGSSRSAISKAATPRRCVRATSAWCVRA